MSALPRLLGLPCQPTLTSTLGVTSFCIEVRIVAFALVATQCAGVTGAHFVHVDPAVPLWVPWFFAAVAVVISAAAATASYVCAAAGREVSYDVQEAGALFVARCDGVCPGLVGND